MDHPRSGRTDARNPAHTRPSRNSNGVSRRKCELPGGDQPVQNAAGVLESQIAGFNELVNDFLGAYFDGTLMDLVQKLPSIYRINDICHVNPIRNNGPEFAVNIIRCTRVSSLRGGATP
jgi:hypothetical protein